EESGWAGGIWHPDGRAGADSQRGESAQRPLSRNQEGKNGAYSVMDTDSTPLPNALSGAPAIAVRPRTVHGKRRFTIVASQFNPEYVQGLVDHAVSELRALAPMAVVTLLQVPGAFEIPIVVRELAMKKKESAFLALGVIIKGQTNHADNLSRSVTDALQRIAIEHGVPVI